MGNTRQHSCWRWVVRLVRQFCFLMSYLWLKLLRPFVALHCFSWLMGVRLLFMMQNAFLCIGGVRVSRRCHGCGAWLHSNVSISLLRRIRTISNSQHRLYDGSDLLAMETEHSEKCMTQSWMPSTNRHYCRILLLRIQKSTVMPLPQMAKYHSLFLCQCQTTPRLSLLGFAWVFACIYW